MDGQKYIGVEEAAAMTGMTQAALYRKVARGQIPYRKWGRRVLFKRSELVEFIDALPGMRTEEVRRRWNAR
jgi:excisionase family DNA binding protein